MKGVFVTYSGQIQMSQVILTKKDGVSQQEVLGICLEKK
jgi:hypothetical protein